MYGYQDANVQPTVTFPIASTSLYGLAVLEAYSTSGSMFVDSYTSTTFHVGTFGARGLFSWIYIGHV